MAKEGGYYQKYGLDVDLVFGVHPAGIAMLVSGDGAMTNYTLEQSLQASVRDGSFVFIGSPFTKSLFALMANKAIPNVKALKGKRIAVSQIGDAPHNYAIALLERAGLNSKDVQWMAVGTDVNGRAAALVSGRVDATMLTAPAYFELERQGFKSLANIADDGAIYAPTMYLMRKSTVAANPKLPELLIKAHAEAIKRIYDDKAFATQVYSKYSPAEKAPDVALVWDQYTKANTFERVPYILTPAMEFVLAHPPDAQVAAAWKAFNFKTVADNSTVDRLVKEGFFEKLFGPSIKAEETRKAKLAYR
jgi:ABC-type nitrate/sulfonate/bicarbonate transport system substrate-binding protein